MFNIHKVVKRLLNILYKLLKDGSALPSTLDWLF